MGELVALVVLGGVAVVGAVVEARTQARHRRVARRCAEGGWVHRRRGNTIAARLGVCFPLLRAGWHRRVRDVVEVVQDGQTVTLFDFSWKEREQGLALFARRAVAVVDLGGEVPTVRIDGESVASRIAGAFGAPPVRIGHAAFDRRFRVRAPERGDAFAVLHPEAIAFLVSQDLDDWELCGTHLLVARRGRWDPAEYAPTAAAIRRFVDLLPDWAVARADTPGRSW